MGYLPFIFPTCTAETVSTRCPHSHIVKCSYTTWILVPVLSTGRAVMSCRAWVISIISCSLWTIVTCEGRNTSFFNTILTSKVLRSPSWRGWPLWNIYLTNDHGYVVLVVNTSWSFPQSWLIIGFVTRFTWRVSLVEQELLILPEHQSSLRVFSGEGSYYSIFSFMCMFCRSLFVLLSFFFWPLCCYCLSFFGLQILITHLLSSNSSFN
jgi:hypothetical protein